MTAIAPKRRKVDSECRAFNDKWTEEYFFVFLEDRPICLICSQSVAVIKEHNVKRHYMLKHADKYDQFTLNSRKEKFQSSNSLQAQQTILKRLTKMREA